MRSASRIHDRDIGVRPEPTHLVASGTITIDKRQGIKEGKRKGLAVKFLDSGQG